MRGRVTFLASTLLMAVSLSLLPAALAVDDPRLLVSVGSDLEGAQELDGAVVSGEVFVFLEGRGINHVRYMLTDTEGTVTRLDAPFHLGGAIDGTALPFDSEQLVPGRHVAVGEIFYEDGSRGVTAATFTVVDPYTAPNGDVFAERRYVGTTPPSPTEGLASLSAPLPASGDSEDVGSETGVVETTSPTGESSLDGENGSPGTTTADPPGSDDAPPSSTSTTTKPPSSSSHLVEAEAYTQALDRSSSNVFVGALKCTLRNDDVDLKSIGYGGCTVGHFEKGEWLEYRVPSGEYKMRLRVFSADSGALHVEVDGRDVTGRVAVPNTSKSWAEPVWRIVETPSFNTGRTLRIVNEEEFWDLDRFELVPASGSSIASTEPPPTTTTTNPPAPNPTTTTTTTPPTTTTKPPTPTTTTTTEPPKPPAKPAGLREYGHNPNGIGPEAMPARSDGEVVTSVKQITKTNHVYELADGTHGGFTIPRGTTVYGSPRVTITGKVSFNDGSRLEGFVARLSGNFIKWGSSSSDPLEDVAVRYFRLYTDTSSAEAIRVAQNVDGGLIEHFEIEGGKNHAIKLNNEDTSRRPRNITIRNGLPNRTNGAPQGDQIQIQGAGRGIVIEHITFSYKESPENGLDVKSVSETGIVIRNNHFEEASSGAMLLYQVDRPASCLIRHNRFVGPRAMAFGRNLPNTHDVSCTIDDNLIDHDPGNGDWSIVLRGSVDMVLTNNRMDDGKLQLDKEAKGVTIGSGNVFNNSDFKTESGADWSFSSPNTFNGGSGWPN